MRSLLPRSRRLADDTRAELVRSLFASVTPTAIIGILFIVVASMAVNRHADAMLSLLGVVGGAAALTRVAIIMACEGKVGGPDADGFTGPAVSAIERVFGLSYLAFATILGLFAARAIAIADVEVRMVVAALVVGYGAGVAAGASLRPWISVPAILAAVVPPALSAALHGDAAHHALALVLLALLAGGIDSMLARYRAEVEKIAMRQTFASLARTDHLTGLANRLALADAYALAVDRGGVDSVALHCLDLDRFKAVNDRLGHPAGDVLLQEVAARLFALCRKDDLAARLGGDEFVVLQTGLDHPDEAGLLARRIVRTLGEPYWPGQQRAVVGVSVGYAAPATCGEDLHDLLRCADGALYAVKRAGGGAAKYAGEDDELRATIRN